MADTGTAISPATAGGATIDTETNASRSGWQMQRLKLVLGAIDADLGDVSPTNPMPVRPVDTSAAGTITAADVASTSTAMANGQLFVTGTPTAASFVMLATASMGSVKYQVTGTWSASTGLVVEQTCDNGITWLAISVHQNGTGTTTSSFTGNFIGGQNVSMATAVRMRAVGAWTGTATVLIIASSNVEGVYATLTSGAANVGTVLGPLPAAPITGQQTLTTAAAALPANALLNGIVITALSANTGTVFVGGAGVTAATGYPLAAGASVSLSLANSGGAYIIGTNATDKVAFAGN